MQNYVYRKTFTLIEMLIVVVIIGILAGALIPRIMNAQARANDASRTIKTSQISDAIDVYKEDNGYYPIANSLRTYNQINTKTFSSFSLKSYLIPSVFAASKYSSVAMLADQLEKYLTTMPTDTKGIAATDDLTHSCATTGNSFGYFTDKSGSIYAITSISESKKGNTNNCFGLVDANNNGGYNVRGAGLQIASASGTVNPSQVVSESCFCPNGDCSSFSGTITTYDSNCSKNVIIPDTINGIPVVSIGDLAMSSKGLQSVIIPNSVKSIGKSAFLTGQIASVVIPDSVTTIGDSAFRSNQLASVVIPDSVTTIGNRTFAKNQIASVIIPSSVKTIGTAAFQQNKISSISIPSSLTSISAQLFYLNQLTSVMIPNSVTYIGAWAFSENQLLSISLGNSVQTLAKWAFAHNYLTSVSVPNSVLSIEKNVFNNNLLSDEQAFLYKRSNGVDDKTSLIGYGGVRKDVVIPSNVVSIGNDTFYRDGITSITIPNSVTTIGAYAFESNKLTSITIPSSVISIGTEIVFANGSNGDSPSISYTTVDTARGTWNYDGTTRVKQ